MRVGREFGRLPHELRDVPLHWLVWDYLALQGAIRVDELIAEGHRIREGVLAAMAMHKPAPLDTEERALKARVRKHAAGESMAEPTSAELLEMAARAHASMVAGRVFDDAPLPPTVVS